MSRRKEPSIPDLVLDQLFGVRGCLCCFRAGRHTRHAEEGVRETGAECREGSSSGWRWRCRQQPQQSAPAKAGGYGKKTVLTDSGKVEITVPRDRDASFDPQIIAKYQRRFPGFEEKIISIHARGMSARKIVSHLQEIYGIPSRSHDPPDHGLAIGSLQT